MTYRAVERILPRNSLPRNACSRLGLFKVLGVCLLCHARFKGQGGNRIWWCPTFAGISDRRAASAQPVKLEWNSSPAQIKFCCKNLHFETPADDDPKAGPSQGLLRQIPKQPNHLPNQTQTNAKSGPNPTPQQLANRLIQQPMGSPSIQCNKPSALGLNPRARGPRPATRNPKRKAQGQKPKTQKPRLTVVYPAGKLFLNLKLCALSLVPRGLGRKHCALDFAPGVLDLRPWALGSVFGTLGLGP